MRRHDRPHVRQPEGLVRRGHFQDELGLALDVRPQPSVERRIADAHGHVFHHPQALARGVAFGPEAAEEIVFREIPGKLLGHLELARAHQSRDDRNAVALPGQRIVGRLARRRAPVQESHHQVGDLGVQTIGETLIRQVHLDPRAHGGVAEWVRPGRCGIAQHEPGRAPGRQFDAGVAPPVFAFPLAGLPPLVLPTRIALVAHEDRRRRGLDGQGPSVVDAQLLSLPGDLLDGPSGRPDAPHRQLEPLGGVAATLEFERRCASGGA